jgi:hypothetical protein
MNFSMKLPFCACWLGFQIDICGIQAADLGLAGSWKAGGWGSCKSVASRSPRWVTSPVGSKGLRETMPKDNRKDPPREITWSGSLGSYVRRQYSENGSGGPGSTRRPGILDHVLSGLTLAIILFLLSINQAFLWTTLDHMPTLAETIAVAKSLLHSSPRNSQAQPVVLREVWGAIPRTGSWWGVEKILRASVTICFLSHLDFSHFYVSCIICMIYKWLTCYMYTYIRGMHKYLFFTDWVSGP